MSFTVLSEFVFSDTIVQYLRDEQQRVGFRLFPQRLKDKIVDHRADLRRAWPVHATVIMEPHKFLLKLALRRFCLEVARQFQKEGRCR